MARNTTHTIKRSIDELLHAVGLTINSTIPNSDSSARVHYQIDIANKRDDVWQQAVPKNNKTKNIAQQVQNIVEIHQPCAISVLVYRSENKEDTRFSVKLTNDYIKIIDGEDDNIQQGKVIAEPPNRMEALGSLGDLMIDNVKIRLENQLENQRISHENEKRYLEMNYNTSLREYMKENEALKKRVDELEKDITQAIKSLEEYEDSEPEDKYEDLKKSGIMGLGTLLASKVFNVPLEQLSGIIGGTEVREDKGEEKTAEFEIEKTGALPDGRMEEVAAINQFLTEMPDLLMRKTITILQSIRMQPTIADEFINLIP